jgi:hypothetical protein
MLQLKSRALIVAGAGLGLALILSLVNIFANEEVGFQLFFQAFLYAWILAFGLAMGSQALLFIHHMTAGAWSFPIQRMLEASARTIRYLAPVFVVYIILVALGFNENYNVWIDSTDPIVTAKGWWLNKTFFCVRSLIYLGILVVMSEAFSKWSRELDKTGDALILKKFRKVSPVALLMYSLLITFAPLDWVMSLEPLWFSTIYGPLFAISQALTIFAVFILILDKLAQSKPMSTVVTVDSYHALSTFMLVFTILWGYMSFSQFLIIWSGNLPEEIHYYLVRNTPFYIGISIILIVGHFFIPFFGLLQKHKLKNKINRVRIMCYFMIAMRMVDVFYFINPAFQPSKGFTEVVPAPWLEVFAYLAMAIGLLAVWLYCFIRELGTMDLMPKNDPRLYAAISHVDEELFENA